MHGRVALVVCHVWVSIAVEQHLYDINLLMHDGNVYGIAQVTGLGIDVTIWVLDELFGKVVVVLAYGHADSCVHVLVVYVGIGTCSQKLVDDDVVAFFGSSVDACAFACVLVVHVVVGQLYELAECDVCVLFIDGTLTC